MQINNELFKPIPNSDKFECSIGGDITKTWVYDINKFCSNVGSNLKDLLKNMFIISHNDLDGYASSTLVIDGLMKYDSMYVTSDDRMINGDNYRRYGKCINVDYSGSFLNDNKIMDKIKLSSVIFITDLSFNQNIMNNLMDLNIPIIWIDHHPTSRDVEVNNKVLKIVESIHGISASLLVNLFTNIYIEMVTIRDIENGVLKESYTYFGIKQSRNTLYDVFPGNVMVSLFDTFHDDKDMRFVYAAQTETAMSNNQFSVWISILCDTHHIDQLINDGDSIDRYVRACAESNKNYIRMITIKLNGKSYKVAIFNTNQIGSAHFGSIYNEVDGCIKFGMNKNCSWSYSVYANKDNQNHLPCDKIAKYYGGGGHITAAGWISKTLITKLLNDIEINI